MPPVCDSPHTELFLWVEGRPNTAKGHGSKRSVSTSLPDWDKREGVNNLICDTVIGVHSQ